MSASRWLDDPRVQVRNLRTGGIELFTDVPEAEAWVAKQGSFRNTPYEFGAGRGELVFSDESGRTRFVIHKNGGI